MSPKSVLIARAVRGPILLITIGVLFALHQAGAISFEKTWPLLIIIFGVIKLIERAVTPRMPLGPPYGPATYTPPPPMAGGPGL